MLSLPSSGPWDEKDLIGHPPLPMFVEVVGPAGSLATQSHYSIQCFVAARLDGQDAIHECELRARPGNGRRQAHKGVVPDASLSLAYSSMPPCADER
jgi:hypothetical protein